MERVKRFQRTLLISLTGINTLFYSLSQAQSFGKSFIYSLLGMTAMLCIIYIHASLKKASDSKRIPTK